jgi:citrate lyase subunit beta/citryl-CoA lyase
VIAYRSMLFVPGHKGSWAGKAAASGADALVLDLEDSVPTTEKDVARQTVARSISELSRSHPGLGLWVRLNSWDSGGAGFDLDAVVVEGLDGLLLPKLYGPTDVLRFETLLTHFEARNGVAPGRVKLIASLETAQGMASCEAIAGSSPRMVSLVGATARDADTQRALGYRYSAEGLETLYLRSRVVLACRAAGLTHPLCGLWQDIADLDGLARFAAGNRDLGYRGQLIIHPSHAGPVNQAFSPSPQELAFYQGMIKAFEAAEADGHGAVDYEGQHIDLAHVTTAREVVAFAATRGG